MTPTAQGGSVWLARADLARLLDALRSRGYRPLGPRLRDGVIVYDELESAEQLPAGWTDEQAPGHYRLRRREDDRLFGFVVGPHSWKRFLHVPEVTLAATAGGGRWQSADSPALEKLAFIGVRACEMAAIRIQDRVLTGGPFVDPHYRTRRESVLFVGVNCTEPGGTCFCASMNTGPRHREGHDLVLTEMAGGFVAQAATPPGRELLEQLGLSAATSEVSSAAGEAVEAAAVRMGRKLATDGLAMLLKTNLEHPFWDEVAARCLSCANCTMACPTCFCSTVEETSDLSGPTASRVRKWDSCFNADFARVHGGNFRPAVRDRYRQWMTHKLSSWFDQFGTSGCVGCGRCITWCPVGIDLTEGAARIRQAPMQGHEEEEAKIRRGLELLAPHSVGVSTAAPAGCLEDGSMVPARARVVSTGYDTADTFTMRLELEDQTARGRYRFRPGQFNMLSLPGIGECAISICSSPLNQVQIGHTVRAVGSVTRALQALKPGAAIGLRGPFGSSWPVEECEDADLILVAGGIGLAPLRPVLCQVMANRASFGHVRLLYGARSPEDMLYARDLLAWSSDRAGLEVQVTVDTAGPDWTGHVGVVTTLFKHITLQPQRTVAMVCGPEVMMRFTVRELLRLGVPPVAILVSMERNMKCAVGFCGHCQYGPHFVCKDGPVFRYPQVERTLWKEGI